MKVIVNTNVILEDGIIFDGVVEINGDRIGNVCKKSEYTIPNGAEIIDANGLYVAPGLIDIHNHGSEEYLWVDEPLKCAEHFIKHGQTTILPTLYCNLNAERLIDGTKKIKETAKNGIGKIIDGIYMEGPYMSGRGSNQKYILWGGEIIKEEYQPVIDEVGSYARIWAIDPAREGIEGFMQDVKADNPSAIFALGHSTATSTQCRQVYKYGVKVQTHHGDSGKAKGCAQGTIGAGCDEFTLYNQDMYAELICDEVGVHVQPDMIKMVMKVKGTERIILITDCMPKSGDFTNNEKDGIVFGPDLNYDYEGHLAGSHLTLDNACRNLMRHTGHGLCHAIRCASLNPAKLLGIDDKVGSIEKGKIANLILIDGMVNVKSVYLQGEKVIEQ